MSCARTGCPTSGPVLGAREKGDEKTPILPQCWGQGRHHPLFSCPPLRSRKESRCNLKPRTFSSTPLFLELEGSDQGLERKGQKKKMLIQNEKPVEG